MKYTVAFIRFFEEFGCYDVDTKEFDTIKEANDFYNSINDEYKKLYVGKDRIRSKNKGYYISSLFISFEEKQN